ncbi:MAG: MBL fold metallo-hydrolase [Candidatus Aminicenantales bacterium]
MELEFWGVRGTMPSPGPDKVRYGGHTPCASLRTADGGALVIDAGTGIKDLGARIMSEASAAGSDSIKVFLLFTHFHLDHIMGLPFFAPLFSPGASITIYAPAEPEVTERYLGGLMAGPYFPMALGATPSTKLFKKIVPGLTISGIHVSTCPLIHPQGSVAYKFEHGGERLVSATDTEHPEKGIDRRLAAFAEGAGHLIYDATFTPDEYAAGGKGWGHSTWLAGTELATAGGIGSLVLSHHSPDHSDDQVDGILESARERFPRTLAARQGLKLSKG